jgi:hypothetical protein
LEPFFFVLLRVLCGYCLIRCQARSNARFSSLVNARNAPLGSLPSGSGPIATLISLSTNSQRFQHAPDLPLCLHRTISSQQFSRLSAKPSFLGAQEISIRSGHAVNDCLDHFSLKSHRLAPIGCEVSGVAILAPHWNHWLRATILRWLYPIARTGVTHG